MDSQQQQFYHAVLVMVLLIGVIIVYFIISIITYHRRYIRLQQERMLAELTIQEAERKRIATDLHDSLGPLLSSVKLQISSVEVGDEEDRRVMEKAGRHIDEIIRSMRQISHNLLPSTLERRGLAEAVREFIRMMNGQQGADIGLEAPPLLQVPKEKEVHIFRMIQEIVNNTLKHASARHLQIVLEKEGNNLLILTTDDGEGFDVEKVRYSAGGLGLKSLETRTDILRGKLIIHSQRGTGTRYVIKIPL